MDELQNDNVKGNGKTKDRPFLWRGERQLMLMRLCKEFNTKHRYNQTFNWIEITKEMEKLTGMKMGKDCARNKYEYMKKIWKAWCDLRFKVTGAGWDQSTGRVTLDDEWWARLKKPDSEKYSKFRKKGVDPQLSDLWDDVFTQKVAVGKHVISPNMDPSSIPVYNIADDNEVLALDGCPSKGTDNVEDRDDLAKILEKDSIDDDGSFHDILNRVRGDASYKDVLASVHETLTTPTTQTSGPSNVKEVNKARVDSKPSNPKHRRKKGSSSMAFNEHMAMVGDTQKKMLSLLEGDVGSTTNGDHEKTFTFVESLAVLERMVGDGLLKEESDMWCFAVTRLGGDEHRHVFMSLPKDLNRVVWIRYEYQTTHKIYKPLSDPGFYP